MSEAAMFRLSEALHGSVLLTSETTPRVLLKFVRRTGKRRVLTIDVDLLARVLQTKADQRSAIRIPGELCITPVMPKGKKTFSMNWTPVDIIGECTAHEVFSLTRMEFVQLQHHLESMRNTVIKYEEGLTKSQHPHEADPPAVLHMVGTETWRSARREAKKKRIAHDETGPSCEVLILEPYTQAVELESRPQTAEAGEMPLAESQEYPPSPDDSVDKIPLPKEDYIPQTLDLID